MHDCFAISMPLHPFVAVVIRVQFGSAELTAFATSEGDAKAFAEEQAVIDRFLSGLTANRLELSGPYSSLVAGNLIAHLADFSTSDGIEPYVADIETFGTPANWAEWIAMTPAERRTFFEGARRVGYQAREAWANLKRSD